MKISKVSPAIAGAILAGVITLAPAAALAQTRAGLNYAAIQITDRDLGGGVHMLFGAGGNMALLVTDQGQLIRTPVTQVRMVSRNTSGVIVFRTAENEHVVSVERLADTGEDEPDDGPDTPDVDGSPEAPEAPNS